MHVHKVIFLWHRLQLYKRFPVYCWIFLQQCRTSFTAENGFLSAKSKISWFRPKFVSDLAKVPSSDHAVIIAPSKRIRHDNRIDFSRSGYFHSCFSFSFPLAAFASQIRHRLKKCISVSVFGGSQPYLCPNTLSMFHKKLLTRDSLGISL